MAGLHIQRYAKMHDFLWSSEQQRRWVRGCAGFVVGTQGSAAYIIDGSPNPTLTLARGQTYRFEINAWGHPFWVKTLPGTGTTNAFFDDGITGL